MLSGVLGFGGVFASLALSKWIAIRSMGGGSSLCRRVLSGGARSPPPPSSPHTRSDYGVECPRSA